MQRSQSLFNKRASKAPHRIYYSLLCNRASEHYHDHRVTPQEHLSNESLPVTRPCPLHALALSAPLGPDFTNILEDHVLVTIKGLEAGKELAIVSAGDEDERTRAKSRGQEMEGSMQQVILLELVEFGLCEVTFWLVPIMDEMMDGLGTGWKQVLMKT